MVEYILLATFNAVVANHSSITSSSGTTSGTTSSIAGAGPVDVLIIPSGTGINVSPLTTVLGPE